jgi:hypothetical protein
VHRNVMAARAHFLVFRQIAEQATIQATPNAIDDSMIPALFAREREWVRGLHLRTTSKA